MDKIKITEDMHLEKEWYAQAREQTIDTLPGFMNHIMDDYEHDYGTICHALSACALAATWAADNHPQGGITGFQAGFVMWGFIRHWMYENNKCGLKIVDYDNMLFLQYEDKFEKTIPQDTFELIQDRAKELLEETKNAHPDVIAHWKSIVDGSVPFGYTVTPGGKL